MFPGQVAGTSEKIQIHENVVIKRAREQNFVDGTIQLAVPVFNQGDHVEMEGVAVDAIFDILNMEIVLEDGSGNFIPSFISSFSLSSLTLDFPLALNENVDAVVEAAVVEDIDAENVAQVAGELAAEVVNKYLFVEPDTDNDEEGNEGEFGADFIHLSTFL